MFAPLALSAIDLYQRHLSPRKGYRCAHAVHHGGTGCSGYAKHAIRDLGLWRAIPAIRQRFRDCKAAHVALRQNRDDGPVADNIRRERRDRRRACRDGCCDSFCFGLEGFACFGRAAAPRGAAAKSCDVNPCDGDVGCSGCSIDICSCG